VDAVSTFERAVEIATEAHAGQVDKAGAPYITHPLRVASAVPDGEAAIVAILHDVVEDSDWTLDRLREEGFSDTVIAGVDAMTRREGEDYMAFVDRAGSDALGRVVKRADLIDNMDRTRLASPGPEEEKRIARYQEALARLDETDVLGG
jgi:(p)ppGpp synthase/HD superfamily hydrolase